jgi:transcriptional regulator with PAS, ATPase and Fis domain
MNQISDDMQKIWEIVHNDGEYPGITISQDVKDSWERSKHYGVNPNKPACDVFLSRAELEEKRVFNRVLIEQALVMMGHLHSFTEGSGFIFALGDRDNCALELIGDKQSLEIGKDVGIIVGANWSEQVMGTTNPALALALSKPVQVCGYENYCNCLSFGTGASSPIYDQEQSIIGILTTAGPYPLINHHTLGMVVAASRAIERQMALKNAYQQSEMANLHNNAIMDSISEGVLTLDPDGRITHMNKQAAVNLGIQFHASIGKSLAEVMGAVNDTFIAKVYGKREIYAEPMVLRRKKEKLKLAVSCTPLIGKKGNVIGKVVILQPMQTYNRLIKRAIGNRAHITFDKIVGQNNTFKYSLKCAQIAARSDSNVILLGESGVGKEMFAQAIHNASSRSMEPFLAINCAALPRELISSELFGYEEGAFTGARKGGNQGKFELADQGTIFLDEIGEMPLDMQGSLLRVLEEGAITRLGGTARVPVNVRIIAATNKNLLEEVEKKHFRADLYYRLCVIDIDIPPLRERKDDIPQLVHHFIKTIAPRLGKSVTGIERDALDVLLDYQWPGNVRELSNVIERAINMAGEELMSIEDLSPEIVKSGKTRNWQLVSLHDTSKLPDAETIQDCLIKNKGIMSKTAKELGISRSTLYRKMRAYHIEF